VKDLETQGHTELCYCISVAATVTGSWTLCPTMNSANLMMKCRRGEKRQQL